MSGKLKLEQIQKSVDAVNRFENKYGRKFKAMVMEKKMFADRSEVFRDEDVFILRGQYDDHNMPFISVRNNSYDCSYTVIANNDDSLTIYLNDRTIDLLPQTEADEVE